MLPLLLALCAAPDPLPGTKPLTMTGDIAEQLVAGVDRFLLKQIDQTAKGREKLWNRDFTSAGAYVKSMEPYRKKLAHILGVRDARHPAAAPELIATVDQPALVGKGKDYDILAVRWKAFADVTGEGLLMVPRGKKPAANIVAIPDADVTPEQLCGLMPGVKPQEQYARRLAESGCRVIVPYLIPRRYVARNGRAKMTDREFLYRSAFEMGRHLIGYELQKVFAAVDWLAKEKDAKVGVIGWGEGGMLALYAAALDTRIRAVGVGGYFGPRERMWEQPIERNVFGLLDHFGDTELVAMIAPRRVSIDNRSAPILILASEGGAPARLAATDVEHVKIESGRLSKMIDHTTAAKQPKGWESWSVQTLVEDLRPGSEDSLTHFLDGFDLKRGEAEPPSEHLRKDFDPEPRRKRQFDELDRHNQQLLEDAHNVRRDFMPIADQFGRADDKKKLDTSSLAAYEKSVERYREIFAKDVVGRFDIKAMPFNARTRLFRETDKVTYYQVVLDVYDDVIAYGLLLLPKDLKGGEKRPVVVCQHGLEGRPEDCIDEKAGFAAYRAFATKLAERGFIVFAPQNLYIGHDKFRTLQRKANLIGKTLFSVIVPQHQQITDWLKTLPGVDGERIGFYGLSYGGKSAMRIPPLVKNYCLSICSADFNDWVWKNASSKDRYSYVWTGEYEIFEWDLGGTFNYAEMAALIAPRPFMVERGHFDGVGSDERVGYEFGKVRHLYAAKLGIGDRAEIEWFVGPHTINGRGTFDFLHKHLKWAKR
ncbi:MAG: dienelactone hydrolase family protein [Gemmataceae bacterium]